MKVFKRIGVSILVVFLTVGLCYCEAWGSVDKERAISHYTTGCRYLEKGQWDKAIAEYNEAIKLHPKYVEAYFNRGNAYDEKGQYKQAIYDFTKAIEINPRFAEAYNNRALSSYFKREYDKAWEDVHKAQNLGYQVHPGFLKSLREASGRQK